MQNKNMIVYAVRIDANVKRSLEVRARSLGVDTSTLARAALTAVATTPVRVQTVVKSDK